MLIDFVHRQLDVDGAIKQLARCPGLVAAVKNRHHRIASGGIKLRHWSESAQIGDQYTELTRLRHQRFGDTAGKQQVIFGAELL